MDSNILNSLIGMLPPDKESFVFTEVQKLAKIPGFRPGKAPISQIKSNIPTDIRIQQLCLIKIFEAFYPGIELKEIAPENLDREQEKLPGRMAAYFLKKPGDVKEVLESMKEEINDYRVDILGEATKQIKELEDIERNTAEIKSEESANLQNSSEMSTEQERSGNPMKNDIEQNMDISQLETQNISFSGNEYLGYMQVRRTQNGGTYYNYYPIAKMDPAQQTFVPLSFDEKLQDFPQFGNINIYSSGRMQDLTRFLNGRLYVIEIDPYIEEDNYNYGGTLNSTQKKIDLRELLEYKMLHDSQDEPYNCFQIVDIPDFSERIVNEKEIRIEMPDPSFEPCEKILIRDSETRLIGPFEVKREWRRGEDSYSCYVYPEVKHRHYIFNVFDVDGKNDAFITIPFEGPRGEPSGQTEAVNVSLLKSRYEDFISNELLLRDLQSLYEQKELNPDGTPDFSKSELITSDIPEEFSRARIQRMEGFIKQNTNQQQTLRYFTDLFANSLREKFETDDPLFHDIITNLTKDPKFMNSISGSRILTEAINQQQQAYEQFCVEKEVEKAQIEEDINKLKEQLSQKNLELEVIRKDAQRNAQKKLEDLNSEIIASQEKLDELTAKLDIAKDIDNLRIEKAVSERERSRLNKEKKTLEDQIDELKDQSAALIRHFRNGADETLAKVADMKINEQIARVLASAASEEKETEFHQEDQEQPVKEQIERCRKFETDDDTIKQRLVDFFHKYRIDYPTNDILNLYICFTQGFLTVLSGEPGTGKTTACDLLAHSIGLDKPFSDDVTETRYVRVQVERGWSSKRDLIGYYNPLTKSFDQNNSGVYHALEICDLECRYDAQTKVPPMTILLDEANLSQMEYYWACFMNAGDQSAADTYIDIGNRKKFQISKGLRFLATINNDHTTESLSPRLIDRAWVISLPSSSKFMDVDFSDYESAISMDTLLRVFGQPADTEAKLDVYSEGILRNLYSTCESINMNISPRTKGAIRSYCLAAAKIFLDDKKSTNSAGTIAADFAISQKILPRVQGHGQSYKQDVLNEFKHFFEDNNLTRSGRILDRIITLGDKNMNYYRFFG